ncbi:MAG TPA: signal peptide peptidase SppA [Hyphomicrobiaceae bacterium]|nr:signal peptide peptidase SppA [Hyphomicrobiaceae bacterium]
MMHETETVLDRRRLRRHVSFWRISAILAALLFVGGLILSSDTLKSLTEKDYVARVSITGTITEDRKQLKMLDKIAEDEKAVALIVFVNSSGGTSTGGEALYTELRKVAAKKPVVAQFGTIAASAGYIVGLGTDHIVARGNSITGSIGVIAQWPEFSGILDKVGVKVNEIRSGELKAWPSPFAPLDEKGTGTMNEMVKDSFKWFLDLVKERRGIDTASVEGLEKGRIFTGRQALESKLVDAIGGEDEVRSWLKEKHKISKDLKIVDKKPEKDSKLSWLSLSSGSIREIAAEIVSGASDAMSGGEASRLLRLDGLVSVWHPSEN